MSPARMSTVPTGVQEKGRAVPSATRVSMIGALRKTPVPAR
jgi:hypothetical protein